MKTEILRMEYITISNHSNRILQNICLNLFGGEIVKLVSENFEGKIALAKILGGNSQPDGGNLYIGGKEIVLNSPKASRKNGIRVIREKRSAIRHFTMEENFSADIKDSVRKLFIGEKKQRKMSFETLRTFGVNAADIQGAETGYEQAKVIQLGNALQKNPRVVVMVSYTPLSEYLIALYRRVFAELSKKGAAVLILADDIDLFTDIADRLYVMNEGCIIGNMHTDKFDRRKIMTAFAQVKN